MVRHPDMGHEWYTEISSQLRFLGLEMWVQAVSNINTVLNYDRTGVRT